MVGVSEIKEIAKKLESEYNSNIVYFIGGIYE